ncbi:Syntaxin-5 [Halotydeus destructor]|nr:Syntaxin-5 [Halotydeus destructor]
MAKDRTQEFFGAIQSLQGPQYINEMRMRKTVQPTSHLQPYYLSYSEFMKKSKQVANDLYRTYSKLEELNRLAKKTTIFDWEETSKDLNRLVQIIKGDINSLNRQIEELRKTQNNGLQRSSNNIESHSKTVVLSLQQQLATMSSSFKNTLELRSQNTQQQKARREQFVNPEVRQSAVPKKQATVIDFGEGSSSSMVQRRPQQQQQQLLVYEDQSTQFIQERADAMQSIESTIVELGTIFNQLATMVQQQDEMITRIDSNVNDTSLNVEAAHQSLLQYFQSVSNNRWLMFKVFGVLFVFFIVFVMFAA